MEIKRCRACLEDKSVEDFYKKSQNEGGYHIKCKNCCKNKISLKEIVKPHQPLISRVGEKRITESGQEVEIINYVNAGNITIRFNQNNVIKNTTYDRFKKGKLENPYERTVYGEGYLGEPNPDVKFKLKHKKLYNSWVNIIGRCYSEVILGNRPSYNAVIVCEEWKCFYNFAEWYDENYTEGFHLDKDLLQKGSKIYSPETCAFVPQEINSLMVLCKSTRGEYPIGVTRNKNGTFKSQFRRNGKNWNSKTCITPEEAFAIYKIEKEIHIKEIADKWKNRIEQKVYQALINYEVEITD